MALLENINNRVIFYLIIVMSRLPYRHKFIFNTKLHSLLSQPVCQRLSWLTAVSSARLCYQQQTSQSISQKDTDKSLISHITDSRLIPSLTKKYQPSPLCTNISLNRTRLLWIEWEGEIGDTQHPDQNKRINNIWNHSKLSHPMAANKN